MMRFRTPLGYNFAVFREAVDVQTFLIRRPAAEASAFWGVLLLERIFRHQVHMLTELNKGCDSHFLFYFSCKYHNKDDTFTSLLHFRYIYRL